ncbi:TetR/AcrR family transcriptional regulator [Leptospira borgpetersenii]|uniref:Transcriptional regulator, AcrR-family n=3 Tax=Leptospira borgpetersenii TaxID=174 RepID=Q04S05_LEPBJ|nr:TetR/AcrR family transcriptional regulator [Leptospira borgpetersenii]EMO62355.1 transcriptional regulator, TetR family [Leptospira borgpetersenii serovar Pomona str. 200901868]ABJ76315.1 Transcriptional regulator, AcrR-family [Leptospira borgpetersenii serovar Hardjo-bovis str. JB197]ABJ79413.1 Transcriptional regulator, AcrR-family [Leptospira borgpetersenii serovar Hardjo-bovis str. L550]AMX58736.1 AcrR family transcriptional regulator [Leptospira borgpetersenii serovar Hardjo]AMX61991.1
MAKDTRDLILKTSLKLFSEQGYHGTTMRQVASKAGMSLGLAYRYFDSKEAILEGIIESHDKILKRYITDEVVSNPSREDLIVNVSESIISLVKENEDYLRLYWNLMLQPKIHRLKRRNIRLVNMIFFETSKKTIRSIKPNYTEFEIKNLASTTIGYMINYLTNKKEFSLDDFRNYLVHTLKNT